MKNVIDTTISINEVEEFTEEQKDGVMAVKRALQEAVDSVENSYKRGTDEEDLKCVLDTMVRYIKNIGASINTNLMEISVYPDGDFIFESLAAMPYYFLEIKEGNRFKIIINGKHSYDAIFRGKIHQSDDHILRIGWLVDLICVEPVKCLTSDINVIKEDEHE